VDKVVAGQKMFSGKVNPLFAKTSGTTSGQYIPLTRNRCPIIFKRLETLFCYIHETGKADFVDGKMIFARKSCFRRKARHTIWTFIWIVAILFLIFQKKSHALFKTNCIEDWESKIDAIVEKPLTKI
jgi:hypothetical protein